MAESKAFPSIRISTPGGNAYSRPWPHTGQRSPTRSSSWRHATRSAPLYASALRRPWPGRWPPRRDASLSTSSRPFATAHVFSAMAASVPSVGSALPPSSPAPTTGEVAEAGAMGAFPNTSVRSRRRLILASCKAKTSQKYHRSTWSNTHRSSAVKALPLSRWRNASPSSWLRVIASGRFITHMTLPLDNTCTGAREMRRLDVADYVTDVKHGSDAVGEGKACGKGALPPPLDGLSPREACAYLPQAPTRVLIAH